MDRQTAPLAGFRVVERSETVAGAYAGRLLSALGADVQLLEPPGGHRLRTRAPLVAPDVSSIFGYVAAGKQSTTIDLATSEGRSELRMLVADADIYIDDVGRSQRERTGTTPEDISAIHPELVYVSVRPFGMSGPKADWVGEEVTLFHSSGEGNLLPNGLAHERHPERAPIKMFGYFAETQAGVAAVLGALASLVHGTGQIVDVSVQDTIVALAAFGVQRHGDGSLEHRSTRSFKYGGVLECADGYVELLTLEDRQWRGLVELVGDTDWADDPALADGIQRGLRGAEINAALRSWALGQRTTDLVAAAQQLGVPAATYARPEQVLGDPHALARGLFQSVLVPGLGDVPMLSGPVQFDAKPLVLAGGPPDSAEPISPTIRATRVPVETSGGVQ